MQLHTVDETKSYRSSEDISYLFEIEWVKKFLAKPHSMVKSDFPFLQCLRDNSKNS